MGQTIASDIKKLLAALVALMVLQTAVLFYETAHVSNSSNNIVERDLPLLIKAKELKMSVVQVQQWLTDISATRGLDGLNDGFDVAAEQADLFRTLLGEMIVLDPEHQSEYDAIAPTFEEYYQVGQVMAKAYVDQGPAGGNKMMENFDGAASAINESVDLMVERIANGTTRRLNSEAESAFVSEMTVLVAFVIVLIFVYFAYRLANSRLLVPLANLKNTLQGLAERSESDVEAVSFDSSRRDEITETYEALNDLITKLKAKAAREARIAADSGRIREALEVCKANVMVADADYKIIFHNDALLQMMRAAQNDIRQQLSGFNAETLIGSNIDIFHKNPAHQRRMLEALNSTHNARIKVGSRSFDLIANPVMNDQKERIGTVVEWQDVTAQLAAETQIEGLIQNASAGQLDQRLAVNQYSGFMLNVAQGINQLLDAVVAPIHEVQRVVDAMAAGDLTVKMSGNFQGEFAQLNNSLNASIQNLNSMISEILMAGNSIAAGAAEISSGNATLSNRTEAQASAIEETAASMEEMTSTVKQNADNSEEARRLSSDARSLASRGEEISTAVISSMQEITKSSHKISEIITVIDEIAFQTNLLALNAAVEAARAGDQGRGFAVVASEVRSLAQRSASAAKEIKDLITDSVAKVEDGSRYVNESGKALSDINESINKVTEIIAEIASAGREQAIGIEQVNTAVTQMDEGTQQNAALVDQVAAASSSMEEQATSLRDLVNRFKVSGVQSSAPQLAASTKRSNLAKLAAQPAAKPPVKPSKSASAPKINKQTSSGEEWEEF